MSNHVTIHMPLVARNFVQAWHDHIQAIEDNSLPYLDHLIDEIRMRDPDLPFETVRMRLYQMVPNLKLGTAGRLLDCKFELTEFGQTC